MARTPNYGFEKRKKEQDRKAKKEAKREDRKARRNGPEGDATTEQAPTDETEESPN